MLHIPTSVLMISPLTLPDPALPPPCLQRQHCPYKWPSLLCQGPMLFWDVEPASCLETGLRPPPPAGMLKVWEAGAGPGKTCHQSCLGNSLRPWRRERAAGSQHAAKYRDIQRWKWFLPAAGGHPVPSSPKLGGGSWEQHL